MVLAWTTTNCYWRGRITGVLSVLLRSRMYERYVLIMIIILMKYVVSSVTTVIEVWVSSRMTDKSYNEQLIT